MCPDCLDVEPEVVELSGRGSLYSYSILHHPQNPQFDYPVIAVLVELEEGLRMVSNLVADTVPDPLIGMPLRVAFAPTQHGFAVPVFERDGSRA
jgi:uncharacterized OB-fold protein